MIRRFGVALGLGWAASVGAQPAPDLRAGAPTVRIGMATGPSEFMLSGVVGATRLPDGTIVVGDAGAHRILFFTPRGTLLRVVGRRGRGPGEYQLMRWVGPCGAGLGVVDYGTRRVTTLSVTGAVLGVRPLPVMLTMSKTLSCNDSVVMMLVNNRHSFLSTERHVPYFDDVAAVVVVRGQRADTLLTHGIQAYYRKPVVRGFAPVPLGPATLAAASVTGWHYACTAMDGACVSWGPGQPTRRFTVSVPREQLSRERWALAKDEIVTSEPSPEGQRILRAVLADLRAPDSMPVLNRVTVDYAGRAWLRTYYDYGKREARWVIVDPQGRVVGRAVLPWRVDPLELGRDYLLARELDSDDVEQVVLYPLVQAASGKGKLKE